MVSALKKLNESKLVMHFLGGPSDLPAASPPPKYTADDFLSSDRRFPFHRTGAFSAPEYSISASTISRWIIIHRNTFAINKPGVKEGNDE
jgi:hypothetical protein